MPQKPIVFALLCAAALAGCASTPPLVSASAEKQRATARAIIGTSLIGAKGATQADKEAIEDTVAGVCGARVWNPSECAEHDRQIRAQ